MARSFTSRKSGFIQRAGRMRRETLWVPISPVTTVLSASQVALVYTASAAEDALRPYTVVRTHLYLAIVTDQLAASENQQMAIGFAIVSDQASGIGVTAVPTPITDLGSDAWYLHQFLTARLVLGDVTGFDHQAVGARINVDSRVMRKVEDGFDNIVTIETTSSSDGLQMFTAGRQLLKLH